MHGSVLPHPGDEREILVGARRSATRTSPRNQVPRSALSRIIRPRVEEILELVRDRLNASRLRAAWSARRMVLTGGGSQLTGLGRGRAARCSPATSASGVRSASPGLPGAGQRARPSPPAVGLAHLPAGRPHGPDRSGRRALRHDRDGRLFLPRRPSGSGKASRRRMMASGRPRRRGPMGMSEGRNADGRMGQDGSHDDQSENAGHQGTASRKSPSLAWAAPAATPSTT